MLYAANVNDLPPGLHARRAIEDQAAKLGVRRRGYETALARNTEEARALAKAADGSGVPLDQLAALLGVSRQTIYNWREGK